MKKLLFILLTLGSFTVLNAQDFEKSIGLRFGGASGVSYKQMLNDENSVEFIGGMRLGNAYASWYYVAGLYQFNFPIQDVDGLNWFVGFGADFSVLSYETFSINDNGTTTESDFGAGIDGMIGLGYTVSQAPISISLDWKPSIQILNSGFWGSDVALSVRYTF
jgi:hypothetical protein